MIRLLSSLAVLVLLSGHAVAQGAAEAIEAGNQEFETAFNRGDGAAVAAFYTEDAAIFPPGAPRIDGREAIETFWQGAIDAGLSDLNLETTEVTETGDLAYEVGTLALNAPRPEGGTVPVTGKYVVVWQRGDEDTWRLHRDIWNLDPPAQ